MLRKGLLWIGAVALVAQTVSAENIDGEAIYQSRCSLCHGVEGRGDGPAGAALQPPPKSFMASGYANTPIEQVKETIAKGRQGTAMLPFGQTLKPEELDAVARYILGLAAK